MVEEEKSVRELFHAKNEELGCSCARSRKCHQTQCEEQKRDNIVKPIRSHDGGILSPECYRSVVTLPHCAYHETPQQKSEPSVIQPDIRHLDKRKERQVDIPVSRTHKCAPLHILELERCIVPIASSQEQGYVLRSVPLICEPVHISSRDREDCEGRGAA